MLYMNGLGFIQDENHFVVVLPNYEKIAEFIVPPDGLQHIDFNTLDGITTLLAKRSGLLEFEANTLRKLKLPDKIRITTNNNGYIVYLNDMQVAFVGIPHDVISAKIIVGIAVILNNRWKDYISKTSNIHKAKHKQIH